MNEPERFRSEEYLAVLDRSDSPLSARFAAKAVETMCQSAEAEYPHEACGLLIGSFDGSAWHIEEVRRVENLNRERAADRFVLDPAAYQAVDRELRGSGREIVGVFHSHPDCPARPSPTDLENAWGGFLYPIVATSKGRAKTIDCWTLNDSEERFQMVAFSGGPDA